MLVVFVSDVYKTEISLSLLVVLLYLGIVLAVIALGLFKASINVSLYLAPLHLDTELDVYVKSF